MLRRILMPTDGSTCALSAAELAADMTARYGAQATAISVVELPYSAAGQDGDPAAAERLTQRANEALEQIAQVFRRAGAECRVETAIGSAVPVILGRAEAGGFDLIVIGNRGVGSGAVARILMGSVAEGIVHGANCSVLMVRPDSGERGDSSERP